MDLLWWLDAGDVAEGCGEAATAGGGSAEGALDGRLGIWIGFDSDARWGMVLGMRRRR